MWISVVHAQNSTPSSTTNRWVGEVMTKQTDNHLPPTLTGSTAGSFKDLFNTKANDH